MERASVGLPPLPRAFAGIPSRVVVARGQLYASCEAPVAVRAPRAKSAVLPVPPLTPMEAPISAESMKHGKALNIGAFTRPHTPRAPDALAPKPRPRRPRNRRLLPPPPRQCKGVVTRLPRLGPGRAKLSLMGARRPLLRGLSIFDAYCRVLGSLAGLYSVSIGVLRPCVADRCRTPPGDRPLRTGPVRVGILLRVLKTLS